MPAIEIGGDFTFDEAAPEIMFPRPWEARGKGLYLQTGRQALCAIARQCKLNGSYEVFLPGYLCDSMIEPFVAEGLTVRFIPVDAHLWLQPEAVQSLPSGALAVNAPYFGRTNIPLALLMSLREAAERGVVFIEDSTHSFLNANCASAGYASFEMASLRKLLPVPDGAWVSGLVCPRVGVDMEAPEARADAMRMKRVNLSRGGAVDSHLGALKLSETLLTGTLEPLRASNLSLHVLNTLDFQKISARRKGNANFLANGLNSLGVSHLYEFEGVPSHLVIETDYRDDIRELLRKRNIFCPIHWPKPLTFSGRWRDDLLSLPIDQRYGIKEMQRIVDGIAESLAR